MRGLPYLPYNSVGEFVWQTVTGLVFGVTFYYVGPGSGQNTTGQNATAKRQIVRRFCRF